MHLGFVQPDAVPEDGTLAAQAMVVVDIEIVPSIGEQFLDPGDLVPRLGDMGLHQAVAVFPPQRPCGGELPGRAGAGESRRDGVEQPAAAVPFPDQRQRFVVSRLGRVEQRRRRVAVHQHLARGQAQADFLGFLEQGIDRLRMDRAVDAARRDPVAQVLAQEQPGDLARVCLVGEPEFGRERVLVQPVQKLRAMAGDHRRLRIVDVGVDEACRDECVFAVVEDLGTRRQQRCDEARRSEVDDVAVGHGHDGVGFVDHRGLETVAEGIAGEGQRRTAHGRHSSCGRDHFKPRSHRKLPGGRRRNLQALPALEKVQI